MNMAAYTQFGYGGYPSANQLLGSVAQAQSQNGAPANAASGPSGCDTAPSPLSGTTNDASSLSPSAGSTTTTIGGGGVAGCGGGGSTSGSALNATGPLSPGAISQTSNNSPTTAAATTTATALGTGAGGGIGIGLGLGLGADHHSDAANAASGASVPGGGGGGRSCCENGRPIMTDPVSGQTVCSCQYDNARLALSSYSRMPATSVGVYGTPYPSTDQNPYPSIGVDSSAFYSPLSNPYALKESGPGTDMTAWTSAGLQPTTGYYSYDPTLAAYGYGAGYDLAARRKNATRESTATLKAWLNEHKKNPYPTKGEKIMLAIITKMTLTQVSTWFANARRRLKKENKMTWEPKNKTEDDDDDAMLSDDEKDTKLGGNDTEVPKSSSGIYGIGGGGGGGGGGSGGSGAGSGSLGSDRHKDSHHVKAEHIAVKADKEDDLQHDEDRKPEHLAAMRGLSVYNSPYAQHPGYNPYHIQHQQLQLQQQQLQQQQQQQQHAAAQYQHNAGIYGVPQSQQQQQSQQPQQQQQETSEYVNAPKNPMSRDCGIPIPATKPKIWSLADTVACKTPPPTSYLGQDYYTQHNQPHQPHHLQHQDPQQDQQSEPELLLASSNGGSLPGQPMPMQPHPAHNSPLSMMSSFVGASPYSRIPMGYAAGPNNFSISNSSNTSSNTNINTNTHTSTSASSSNSSSSLTGMPITPTTPPTMHQSATHQHLQAQQYPHQHQLHHHQLQHHQQHQHHHNHHHQLQQQHHQQQQQQRLGFSEIQPDTPPQTPPSIKLAAAGTAASNAVTSLIVNPLNVGVGPALAVHTTGMCYTSGVPGLASATYGTSISPNNGSVGGGGNGNAGGRMCNNFATRADA